MGEVTGKIPFHDADGDPTGEFGFGEWLLRTIMKKAADNEWAWQGDHVNLFMWDKALEVGGKNAAHFRDKEHLHLINNGTDVDISTKRPHEEFVDSQGHSKKAAHSAKAPVHETGQRAVRTGESPVVSLCTRNAPPDGVVGWQKALIAQLRKETPDWLEEEAGTEGQVKEFRA
ncbi:MAG TPA: hypothetical protein VHW44_30905 [Pseudonocardiaceae bacterium]|jgi:hypothetical protein|nr:hypothetical protein [Pseudonocardiaceae bacterium]